MTRRTITLLVFILLTLLHISAEANVGVFTGTGHSIQLSSTERIQMLSEEVIIVPGRGRFLFDGSVPGFDRVEYDCVFVLKNLDNKETTIQVGFPLNSEDVTRRNNKKQRTSDLIAEYNFISQIENHQYSVRYVRKDKNKRFEHLFCGI